MTLTRKIRDLRYSIFYSLLRDNNYRVVPFGNEATECAWSIHPDIINKNSIVYSGGVGNDVTFERALVDNFGCNVYLFDPSPTGIATMEKPENQIPKFKFAPLGLSGMSGSLKLAPPQNAEEGSWYLQPDAAQIEVPCTNLESAMRQNGHNHIDLLKLDIEGSEYSVIDELIAKRIPVKQVCVEYHHGIIPGIPRSLSIRSMLKLRRHGYKMLCDVGTNHTFLKIAG